ncbi:MAG TPA: O-antigen ligase family protein [Mycobacteriales bacterium]|nr:O-antigen ligase family protein [Mycobacteriales bacterium]HWC34244.1 O-antigen ligase family protein [Mycobacteriales bacterium]
MGVLIIDGGTALAALVCLYSRPTAILGLLIASMMLVPSTLIAPHMLTSYATVNHILIGAAAVRLAVMAKQGGRSKLFTATPLHLGLALLLLAWVADGLAFAPPSGIPTVALQRLINLGFVAGFFVVTLALCRLIDNPRFVVRTILVTFTVSAVLALIEHLTKQSFGEHWFDLAGEAGSTTAAHVLETRAGHVRVRSSAEFALAYAWLAVMVLPLLTATVLRMRHWLVRGLPLMAVALAAIYWTYARSAAAAVPVVFVLLAVLLLERRAILLASTSILAAAGLFFFDAAIRRHLSLQTDVGSVGVRFQRLPPILDAVSHHAYLGLGIGGLQTIGVPTTDNFYLYAYGDTGVVGAAILVVMCATALLQAGRGLAVKDPYRKRVIVGCLVGVVAFLVSGVLEDALLLSQPAELVMLLLALATATQEPELGTALMPKWSFRRIVFFGAIGSLVGVVAMVAAPVTVSQQRLFSTVSPERNVGQYDAVTSGRLLIATVCHVAHAMAPSMSGVHVSCLDDYGAAGVGTMRISSPSAKQTLHAYDVLTATLQQTSYLAFFDTQASGPPISARASIWRTAPASGAALGVAIGFVAPLPLRRRRRAEQARGPVRYRFAPIFG